MTQTQQFYDGFAAEYAHIFSDWDASVKRQSEVLKTLLKQQHITGSAHLLDCTCGIGTQAIALALAGYHVHATDLSPNSVEQAKINAGRFEVSHLMTFGVADVLQAPDTTKAYDAVFAMDNPFAHMLTEDDLRTSFQYMVSQAKPGGLIMTSFRDYDAIIAERRPNHSHMRITDEDDFRRIMFQVWDWSEDGTTYDAEMFVITRDGDGWLTTSHTAQSRAWQRSEISQILSETGLSDIQWHMPEKSNFYQPIVSAICPRF